MNIDELISNFELLGGWEERYTYLIDLGRKLPGLPEKDKIEAYRVHGCQAMVWLRMDPDPVRPRALRMHADSDAFIVRGLIAVLTLLFDGRTPEEILQVDAKSSLGKLGLDNHLSPTRKNGLYAMVERIRALAAEQVANSGKAEAVPSAAGGR